MKLPSCTRIIFLLLALGVCMSCKKNKIIMESDDNITPTFTISGYAKSAPFSSDPSFYCSLEISARSFSTGTIESLLVFKPLNDTWGFIYEDIDKRHILVTSNNQKEEILQYAESFSWIFYKPVNMKTFDFKVLGTMFKLKDVDCVLFLWDSGDLRYYGFKNIRDGVASSFSYKYIKDKADKNNSGKVYFTKWESGLKDWPIIEKFESQGHWSTTNK